MQASDPISLTRINKGSKVSKFGPRPIPAEAVISNTAKIGKKCKVGYLSIIGADPKYWYISDNPMDNTVPVVRYVVLVKI